MISLCQCGLEAAFLTIYCLAFILREFSQLPAVKYAFFGIRASVLALLVKAVMMMYKKSNYLKKLNQKEKQSLRKKKWQ